MTLLTVDHGQFSLDGAKKATVDLNKLCSPSKKQKQKQNLCIVSKLKQKLSSKFVFGKDSILLLDIYIVWKALNFSQQEFFSTPFFFFSRLVYYTFPFFLRFFFIFCGKRNVISIPSIFLAKQLWSQLTSPVFIIPKNSYLCLLTLCSKGRFSFALQQNFAILSPYPHVVFPHVLVVIVNDNTVEPIQCEK